MFKVLYTFDMEKKINHLELITQTSKKTMLMMLILCKLLDKSF